MTDVTALPRPAEPWQIATVTGIVSQTPRIKSFFLKPSRPFSFLAGQHVDLRLTAPDGYHAIRSYSIASAPEQTGLIELAIEYLKGGEVSPFFHETVAVGDEIELRGPLGGHFVWSEADGGPLLLVGGGSGLVPLMAMIRHRQAISAQIPVTLLLSARAWDDILYRDELLGLEARRDGFALILTLTREKPRRTGDYGRRVDATMMEQVLATMPAPPKITYVCGTNPFVNEAADGAIGAGVDASHIRTERYGA